jgi:hypothetical protein
MISPSRVTFLTLTCAAFSGERTARSYIWRLSADAKASDSPFDDLGTCPARATNRLSPIGRSRASSSYRVRSDTAVDERTDYGLLTFCDCSNEVGDHRDELVAREELGPLTNLRGFRSQVSVPTILYVC